MGHWAVHYSMPFKDRIKCPLEHPLQQPPLRQASATSFLPGKQSGKPNVVGVAICLPFWRKRQSDKAKPLKEAGEPAHTKVSKMPGKAQDPRELLSEPVLELESPPVELPNSEARPHSQG